MINSENIKQYPVTNQYSVLNLISLFKKMLSYKALMLVSALIGVVISLVWGMAIYQPSYNVFASFTYKVPTNSTLTDIYGVQYLTPYRFVSMINHPNMVSEYIKETDSDDLIISKEKFLKPFNATYDQGIISVTVKDVREEKAVLYKEYIDYCVESFNESNRDEVVSQLKSAKLIIEDELNSVEKIVFETETLNASNYSYRITLQDRIKSIDTQIAEIEDGAIRTFSDYEMKKVSSRAKNMVLIVIVFLVLGFFADFLICILDKHIYFSEDITDVPVLRKKLLSCVPLYRGDNISNKEFINIVSILPDEISSISVSEISDHAGAKVISGGLQKVSQDIKTEYAGGLVADADILSHFSKYSINLIVLRAGIDTINQVKNIVHDCRIKGVDNYFFILYGLQPSDKMITRFEDDSQYIKYPILSYRTLGQHYRKYYNLG